ERGEEDLPPSHVWVGDPAFAVDGVEQDGGSVTVTVGEKDQLVKVVATNTAQSVGGFEVVKVLSGNPEGANVDPDREYTLKYSIGGKESSASIKVGKPFSVAGLPTGTVVHLSE